MSEITEEKIRQIISETLIDFERNLTKSLRNKRLDEMAKAIENEAIEKEKEEREKNKDDNHGL